MNWISVADRLPEPGTWVLAWTGEYHWIAQIEPTYRTWIGVYENEYWHDPQYWMPLPNAPTQAV